MLTSVTEAGSLRSAGPKPGAEPGFGTTLDALGISPLEILGRLPIALLIVRETGEILVSSEVATQTLNRTGTLVGQRLNDVLAPVDTLLAGVRENDSSVAVDGPNGQFHVGYSISDLLAGGTSTLYAIVFRDITKVAHVAPQRDRLVHLAAVGAAAPAVIHQVKNSLAAITMGLGLLGEEAGDADLSQQASALANEAESVAYQLDAFGAAGRAPRSRRSAELERTLTQAYRALGTIAHSADVRLEWRVQDMGPVYLDPGLVHTFVVALGTNAIEASPAGATVVVDVGLEHDTFIIRVQDSGVGMSADVLAQATQLFYANRGRGRGIGLTLCDQAVRAGGGTLDIQSELGRGTRVTLSLPRALEFER